MKIANEVALASHMARAFEVYANLVQNGAINPWRPFLEGADYVDVRVTLVDGGMAVEAIPKSEPTPAIFAEPVPEAEASAEVPPDDYKLPLEEEECPTCGSVETVLTEPIAKPKRKRKTE